MAMKTVALLHPGEMGSAIGACLGGLGLRVVWASAGRSAATRSRAKAAGLEDLGAHERALGVADIVLSVRSEEHTSELQSRLHLVCRLLLEKKKKTTEC